MTASKPYGAIYWLRAIIARMIKIYRMWVYVRIAEAELFRTPDPSNGSQTTTSSCNDIFCQKRTFFGVGRRYKSLEGVKACIMAQKLEYITLSPHRDGLMRIGISGEGLKFTSYSALVDALAKTILNVGTILTVMIALVALVVSILAFKHK